MDLGQQRDTASEPQLLGGNIELSGFRELDGGSMIVLKKIIGNYARKFSDNHGSEKLTLQLARDTDGFALTGSVHVQGQQISAGHSDKNVFYLVDSVLKKLEQELTSARSV
jgi:hypothetical protein